MVVLVESPDNSKVLINFVKEIKSFQDYLKTKKELPEKLLEVKATL
jgi:hypothetical protein